jgi:hypothetical protein
MQNQLMAAGAAALLALGTAPLSAQSSVDAGVVVHSGGTTVGGHVTTGSPPPAVVVREPVREVIVVEPMHVPRGRAHGWWKKQGYREVRVYSDGRSYYAHPVERRPGISEVVVYEREGRYYRWADDDAEGHGHHGGHGKHD